MRGQLKKVITLQRAMTKKRSSVFSGKKGDTRQLPPRVTPTLVTPPVVGQPKKKARRADVVISK